MKSTLIGTATLMALTNGYKIQDIDLENVMFQDFISTHGKSYSTTEEYKFRFEIFKKTLAKIRAHPKDATHTIGLNQFADFTEEEFKKMLGDHDFNKGVKQVDETVSQVKLDADIPASVNWVTAG